MRVIRPGRTVRAVLGAVPDTAATRAGRRSLERAASLRDIARSGLFDQEWYEAQAGRRFPTARQACRHYVATGRQAGLSPHPLFEPAFADPQGWQAGDADPYAAYLRDPRRRRRPPHPLFDPAAHVALHPAADRHPYGPLGHFLRHAEESTPLPVPPELAPRGVTWGALRRRLLEHAHEWARQDAAVRARRLRESYDWDADRAYLARARTWPVPASADRPLVSVVMAVRNRPEGVAAAIRSVQQQELADWQLVVVDDGSTDATPDVVRELAGADPRITLVRTAPGGVAAARNRGITHARGRLVTWLDSDDTWTPHFLRVAVAAMARESASAAYASAEVVEGSRRRYRTLAGGAELLEITNHVQLDALVLDRDLLAAVGPFDETLSRGSDYDLVWRLAERSRLVHLPFVGVVVAGGTADRDRVSVREPGSWREVVKNRRLIDWAQLEATSAARAADRVSVLIPTVGQWAMTWRAVRAVLDRSGDDVEVVVCDNGSRRVDSALLAAHSTLDRRFDVVRSPVNVNFALGSNLAFARSTGAVVVFLNNDTTVTDGWLEPLRQAMGADAVAGAQPLLRYPDGTVQCAGVEFPRPGHLPSALLAHHPVEDALACAPALHVQAATGAALVLRADDVIALRGFDPLFVNGHEDVDLCLRLALRRPGSFRVPVDSQVVHWEGRTPGRGAKIDQNRARFLERWRGRLPVGDPDLLAPAGLVVAHYVPDPSPDKRTPPIPRPLLVRPPRRLPDGTPSLRWAIKTSAPFATFAGSSEVRRASALAAALRDLGQVAVVDSAEAYDRSSAYLDDVVLVLRGPERRPPQPGRLNVLWLTGEPRAVAAAELDAYDVVAAADDAWVGERRAADAPVVALPSALDPQRAAAVLVEEAVKRWTG